MVVEISSSGAIVAFSAPSRARLSFDVNALIVLREDLTPRLDQLFRELIVAGHCLLIESQDGQGPAPFPVGDGLRLNGDAGVLNAGTVLPVIQNSIGEAHGDFFLDLAGLDNFAMLSWVAVLRATQEFRSRNGILRIRAQGSTRRLIEMSLAIRPNTNLKIT